MNYQETLDYLFSQLPMFQRIGPAAFKKDLTRTIALCDYLGNPEKQFRSIHIAGTNGKGSVSNMLAAICSAGGLKTGLYTSPHYKDFRERIRINGEPIPKKEVVEFVQKLFPLCQELQPSFFELTVAMAFDYFARQKVDVAIIETGLGGRLDSTNVITPLFSIITNIDFDHQQLLGNSLVEIATEKAGIIKPGVPVVISQKQPECEEVFIKKALTEKSPLFFADQQFAVKPLRQTATHTFFEVRKEGELLFKSLALNHLGPFQQLNLPPVLSAFYKFKDNLGLREVDLIQGLFQLKSLTGFQGRWELINLHPRIMVDSAHNAAGIRQIVPTLQKLAYKKLFIVLGVVQDKDLAEVLPLLPENATYFFAKANIPRGLDAHVLQQKARQFGLRGKAYSSIRKGLAAARKMAHPNDDLIFVGGSIFTVAEVL